MTTIRFEKFETHLSILNPLKGFTAETHRVEVRRDPLLGHKSVYNPRLKEKVKFFFEECDSGLIDDVVKGSARTCVFCPGRIETSTPRYPSDFVAEGRLKVGEAVLFPNLYPLGKYHSVITLTKTHFLRLSEFTPEVIHTGLLLARQFVSMVYKRDQSATYVAVNANYTFAAGATLIHPHLQMLITPMAFTHHENLIDASRNYYDRTGSSYFQDLAAEEKNIVLRYVARRGGWHWITAFSPLGMNEINALHEGKADFGLLTETELYDLSYGISKVLLLYEGFGHLSFNYCILSVRDPLCAASFRCLLRIINRQNLYANYRNDDYFLQKLLHSDFIVNPPEELAGQLRQLF
jgi:UDPglucose--hexose-1-phosphate uridylyltransferase